MCELFAYEAYEALPKYISFICVLKTILPCFCHFEDILTKARPGPAFSTAIIGTFARQFGSKC